VSRVEIVDDLTAAAALAPAWDDLAVECTLPLCAPGWMLAWWKHVAGPERELRILAVHDGAQLIALAPWFVQRDRAGRVDMRFLGAEMSDRVDILCRAGREGEAANALRDALRGIEPHPDLIAFEAVPLSSRWTRRLTSGLMGHVRLGRYRTSAHPAPAVNLPAGPPETWFAGRSSNFRSQMGRMRRKLERQGGIVRQISDASEIPGTLRALLKLHAGRWEGRGESGLARAGVAEMLGEAADALGPDRLRLWTAEIDGEPISVQLFIAAGGEVKYWNGGWSEEHAALKPSMLTILAALEDAISRGERRLDLGVGTHPYKLRFADHEDTLTWGGLVVHNRRWARTTSELAPATLRYRTKQAVRSMPAPVVERLEKPFKPQKSVSA
jgi:CelD/BcsL family acetyltransferase involved in cellulose biosynthesis